MLIPHKNIQMQHEQKWFLLEWITSNRYRKSDSYMQRISYKRSIILRVFLKTNRTHDFNSFSKIIHWRLGNCYDTINFLRQTFLGWIINRNGDVNRSPRSCDLTASNYFFLCYINAKSIKIIHNGFLNWSL